MQEIIEDIVTALVDKPEAVSVSVTRLQHRDIIELTTSPDDVGAVIGRKGVVVSSIRNILIAYSGKTKRRIELDYVTEREKHAKAKNW